MPSTPLTSPGTAVDEKFKSDAEQQAALLLWKGGCEISTEVLYS
jgi:hypothetical protein